MQTHLANFFAKANRNAYNNTSFALLHTFTDSQVTRVPNSHWFSSLLAAIMEAMGDVPLALSPYDFKMRVFLALLVCFLLWLFIEDKFFIRKSSKHIFAQIYISEHVTDSRLA